MKRFLAISLMLSSLAPLPWGGAGGRLLACGWEGYSHNNYMFSVFPREQLTDDLFASRLNTFWDAFSDDKVTEFSWQKNNIKEGIEKRGDRELLNYFDMLEAYLDISQQLREAWTYPTKEELRERRARLESMITAADNYRGQRLRPQYQLLRMRANMVLGRHQVNKTFYEQTASKLPASVYRDMMRNIYAGALLHLGQRQRACDIYAEQGDMVSIKWCVRKMRNLAGIQALYNENPNSSTLLYLVQDFVNNAQETLDSQDEDWIKEVGASPVYKAEVMQFIDFANGVVDTGASKSPALWKAAAGTLHYLLGNTQKAVGELNAAMTLRGTPRMNDNARAIRLIAMAAAGNNTSEWSNTMVSELQWLDGKIIEERAGRDTYSNHYTDIKDRLCHQVLYPKFKKAGKLSVGIAALAMMSDDDLPFCTYNPRSPNFQGDERDPNPDYSSEFFSHLDSLTISELEDYYHYVTRQPTDVLERYFTQRAYRDDNFFCDLIGTRYLAQGEFAKALPWLEKTDLAFLSLQNISGYMKQRDYTQPKWIVDQRSDDFDEGPRRATFAANTKAVFCKQMLSLQSKYQMANQKTRPAVAYDLAKRYYQASYLGDCWFLTHYGWSSTDTVRTGEKDFVSEAVSYLQAAKKTDNLKLRQEVLYALAYIPLDPWADFGYDWTLQDFVCKPRPQSRQYRALQELGRFAASHPTQLEPYVSHCDVLKQFR